jgi:prepilin-type N-terminal cleavage/methylation domain-containing protein
MMRKTGFTLIELLLVIALLSITVGITTNIIVAVTRSYTKTQVANEIEQNANFLLLKLERDLRNAKAVTASSNTLNITDSDDRSIVYNVDGSTNKRVTRQVAAGTVYRVTNDESPHGVDVTCSGDCFQADTSSTPTVVKLNLIFRQRGSDSSTPASFTGELKLQNTIVVRGTY